MLILRQLARYRFLRSSHIAALVDRSLDRTNDRLCRLYHAGYVDRPRAQLDYYPTSGSAPMVYALGDLGAQLLTEGGAELANLEWSRKNGEAGRPFIEHQLEIVEFHLALERSTRGRSDVRLIYPEEIIVSSPERIHKKRNPFALRATISQSERAHDFAVVPDLVFGLMFPDGSRRCFMVEIDRGTMPISRSDSRQTSFERKMHAYLTAYGQGQHTKQLGWKTFRVLVVTTNQQRIGSMIERLHQLNVQEGPVPSLFLFSLANELQRNDPLTHFWQDGSGRAIRLK
ncbi:replication-relaxation family protein [Bradyrhizobium liaoningense]|uniref:replication-relaxation family protein n=1 Tax=Bradyrhizobium liaoningense TaxID=43992 RepID=UPI0012FDBABC|nr:replication-relaxation family protein [Bradyrhizobium liaoningense]